MRGSPTTLPTAVGALGWSGAPQRWEQALLRAARLLGPSWGSGQRPVVLAALALTVHTASVEQQRPPAEVPLETVQHLLRADPAGLRSRILAALTADGVDRADPLWGIGHDLTRVQEVDPDLGDVLLDIAPEAEIDGLAVLLAGLLDGMTADQERALPAPPGLLPPLRIELDADGGHIQQTRTWAGGWSADAIRCPVCRAPSGGALIVDGPVVTYACPAGHTSTVRTLAASDVRTAMAASIRTDTDAEPTPGTGLPYTRLRVTGILRVPVIAPQGALMR
ncbi:hypothetical protein ACIHEI_37185 [Kitasatospora sp. NPDC051984]|uniref:hypothetical protein n=1 Tax=Kitasatospora sp. NPDC051984 TaxID=3364059 RepID=UPI0037C8A33A